MAERFSIAHVTPYAWESGHEVNTYVHCVATELAARGHSVLILAPSRSQTRVRQARSALRAARGAPDRVFDKDLAVPPGGADGPRRSRSATPMAPVLAIGEVLEPPGTPRPAPSSRRRSGALSIDVTRTLEEIFSSLELDFVHVHEPFAPSAASAALRHSRSLNVGSFHAPTEPLLSTQVTRRFVEGFFGRLDARTASFLSTARLMERHFPATYDVVGPGCDDLRYGVGAIANANGAGRAGGGAKRRAGAEGEPVRVLLIAKEERAAGRLLLRALRRLEAARSWEATVVSAQEVPTSEPAWGTLRAALREHVHFRSLAECQEAELLADADIVVCASDGSAPAPALLLRALAQGAAGLASRLPAYEEVLGEGERGLLFTPRDPDTLAAQLARLIDDAPLRERLALAGQEHATAQTWSRTADAIEEAYRAVAARRRPARSGRVRRSLDGRELIDVDLHMHTDHSPDCATPVEVLLATARERGLGAIAVTDHNEISGALEAREQAAAAGVKVIVGEEVKTASQGEVIGLFLERKIERGMSLEETVTEIKRQGGVVYVPHPFDRLHSVPDYEHLLPILSEIDAIEVFNPRVAIDTFNEEAFRFAAKYRISAGAGSDSHVPQGLGSVRIRMRDFDGPAEFLESLEDADIVTRPTSLLYVQALKFLQTKATPAQARRARSARRVRRVTGRA